VSFPQGAPAPGSDVGRIVTPPAGWVAESPSGEGLALYLEVLRARLWLIVLFVALCVGSAAAYVSTASKVYKATTSMLVTPISRDNPELFGLGLVTESGDPTHDVETLAQLVTTPTVAERARSRLGLDRSARAILHDVSAQPVAQSSIIAITASEPSGRLAADVANAFGEAAIAERTARLHALLDSLIPQLRAQLNRLSSAETAAKEALGARLQELQTLRLLPDPTLHLETRAVASPSPVSPRPVLSIAAAFVAALVLGIGAVLGSEMLDSRIGREEDLRRYRIPILGRIPLQRRRTWFRQRGPLTPDGLSRGMLDAYRRLGISLAARIDSGTKSSIFVTSAGPANGKTTTSINLAAALEGLDQSVILVESDTRRPVLGRALSLGRKRGLSSVVTGGSTLAAALEESSLLPGVRVLSQEPDSASAPIHVSPEAADLLLNEARHLADWLVVDGPALNLALEALPLAKRVGTVILVVRLGITRSNELAELAELLTQHGITPDGFVIVGGKNQVHYYG
jgi:succinoglycan biosynthesis transport protein ExoP